MLVLGANEAMIDRFGPEQPAVWDPSQFEWARRVEAGYPDVRAEVEALLAGPTDIPHIEDVTGGIPQGNIGPWRSFVLMHQGRWIDWNCERCPRTTALARSIPGLSMVGFSVLEPGTHITEHRGPNKGALRYQLGVIVPGEYGDCRIRVGNEMLRWVEGEGVMFDFTVPHEAWNDSDAIRVLLMLEVATPLPRLLAYPNRLAQRAMAWFPTTRDITRRLRALEPTLVRGTPSGPTP
jgi:aspartyl/asparaginyl beta-hydroxylase (cupin superfamily)